VAYDEKLAARLRIAFGRVRVSERRMFGGLAFLHRGNLCCGIVGDELMVRVGPAAYADALQRSHARRMDFTGRPLKGYVYVAPAGFRSAGELAKWVSRALSYVKTLPSRPARRPSRDMQK